MVSCIALLVHSCAPSLPTPEVLTLPTAPALQVASRIVSAFTTFKKYDKERQVGGCKCANGGGLSVAFPSQSSMRHHRAARGPVCTCPCCAPTCIAVLLSAFESAFVCACLLACLRACLGLDRGQAERKSA